MREVVFGTHHTAEDWGLILNAKSITPPTPKVVKISVDGRDGEINLSRSLTGDMKFNNREASFTFLLTEGTQSEREELLATILNAVHGQELQIIEPDRPDHYLLGECSIKNIKNDRAYGSVTITADCEPFYYDKMEVNRAITLTSTATNVVLTNSGRKTVIPTLTVTSQVTIVFDNTSVALSKGTYKLSALQLRPGGTTIKVSGSGTLTVTYREAVL